MTSCGTFFQGLWQRPKPLAGAWRKFCQHSSRSCCHTGSRPFFFPVGGSILEILSPGRLAGWLASWPKCCLAQLRKDRRVDPNSSDDSGSGRNPLKSSQQLYLKLKQSWQAIRGTTQVILAGLRGEPATTNPLTRCISPSSILCRRTEGPKRIALLLEDAKKLLV